MSCDTDDPTGEMESDLGQVFPVFNSVKTRHIPRVMGGPERFLTEYLFRTHPHQSHNGRQSCCLYLYSQLVLSEYTLFVP